MKNYYLKPWTIVFVLFAFLAVVFTACKDEAEGPEVPPLTHPFAIVESEKGSVIQIEDVPYILSEYKWTESGSLKSVIEPHLQTYDDYPNELLKHIGKKLEFSGKLSLTRIETITIDGVTQDVYKCFLDSAELHFNDGSRAGETSRQAICGTQFTDEDYANVLALSMTRQRIEDSNPLIKLYVSILRRTNGTGFNLNKEAAAESMLNKLNSLYSSTGIQFVLTGSQYLDIIDSYLYNNAIDPIETNKIYEKYNHDDALDVFVFSVSDNRYDNGELAGQAKGILSNACFMYNQYYDENDLAHEVGHCLGLFHTHHGTSLDERGEGTIPELVNGSNSSYAGDLIIDTPADPNTWENGLFHDMGLRDLNGDIYNPDPFNLMSYSYKGRLFTPMQAQKMLTALNSTYRLKNILVRREIPDSHLKAGDTIFVKDLLSTDIVEWTITNNEERPPRAMRVTSNERYIVTSTEESQFFDLKAKVTTAEGKVIELTGKVTSGAPNPDLGMIQWMAEYEIDEDKEVGRPEEEGRYGTYYEDGLSYCDVINVYGNTTVNFRYFDLACGPIPCTFKWVTSTNRVIEDTRFILSPADCSDGYLEIYVVDKYGQMDESRPFSIPVTVHGRYYAAKVAKGVITFEGRSGNEYLKNSETAPKISKIDIYNKAGKLILSETRQKASVATLSLTPLAKGSYKAVVSDNNSFSQDILFEI